MPTSRVPGCRELINLSLAGGRRGRRERNDNCPWNLHHVHHIITPRDDLVVPNCDERTMNCSVHETDDELSQSSSECSGETQIDTDSEVEEISNVQSLVEHRLINLPNLISALDSVATCKHCTMRSKKKTFENFLFYCAEKKRKMKSKLEGMSLKDVLETYETVMDVTVLFNEWMKDHPEEEDVKSLLVSDVTYGLATNTDIMCTMCKTDNRFTKHRAAIWTLINGLDNFQCLKNLPMQHWNQ
jgi:hypothetical protein